uniref:Gsp_42 putative toxin n=1 Tax=Gemmula speciosa TaxID=439592 RepID=A0A098LWA3_GEMSP
MSFYLKLTLAVLVIGLMTVDARSVNGAEMRRFPMKIWRYGMRTSCTDCTRCCNLCYSESCMNPHLMGVWLTLLCNDSCMYCLDSCSK